VTHGVDDTVSGVFMEAALGTLEDGKHYSRVFKELSNRGYLPGKASDIRRRIERYMEKQAKGQTLTERETAELNVFHSECAPLIAERVLNNEHFLRELIAEDASLVERLLGKLADLRESTSRVRDPEARAVIKEIRAIEETLLGAVAERGMVYRDRKLVMVDREEEREEEYPVKPSLSNPVNSYSYDALIKKEPLKIVEFSDDIPIANDGKTMDRKAVLEQARANAKKQNNSRSTETATYVYVPSIGKDVLVGKKGLDHGLSHGATSTALATMSIGDLLTQSIAINELDGRNGRKKTTDMSYVLLAAGKNKTDSYVTRIVVDKTTHQVTQISSFDLYAVRTKKGEFFSPSGDEAAASKSSSPYLLSSISIADFLEKVKDIPIINEVFSKDVAAHLGIPRNSGDLTGGLRYSRKAKKPAKPANEHAFDDAVRRIEEREAGADVDAKAAEGEAVTRTNEEKAQVGEGEVVREEKPSEETSKKRTVKTEEQGINEYKLPEDPRALELRGDQRKALANWNRNKVYSRKDAMEIVDGVVKLIGKIAAGNSEDGKNFQVAKVLGRVRERSIDQLFAELNTASTPTEREAVAQKIAEQMIAEARVEVFLSDEEAGRAKDIILLLKQYRKSMNLSEIESEAKKPANEHAFDDAVARMEERDASSDRKAAEGNISSAEKVAEGGISSAEKAADDAVTRTNEEKVQVSEGEAQKKAAVKEASKKKIADNSALLEREIERRLTRELRDAKTKEAKTAIALRLADVITREGAVLDVASEVEIGFFTAKFGLTLAKAGRICYNIKTEFFTEWISPKGNERYV